MTQYLTTPEQSKRLRELGLRKGGLAEHELFTDRGFYPAYHLQKLLEVLPLEIEDYELQIFGFFKTDRDTDGMFNWRIEYVHYLDIRNQLHEINNPNQITACVDMIERLVKEGYLVFNNQD